MATAHYHGTRPTTANVVTGAGYVRGLMVSHNQVTAQTVTLYDNTAASGTILMQFYLAPECCPFFVLWPISEAPHFTTGLSYVATNCEISLWAVKD